MTRYFFSREKPINEKPDLRVLSKYYLIIIVGLLFYGCHSSSSSASDSSQEVKTPVTVTSVSHVSLNDSIELNATSGFLQQNIVKSNLNGYITKSSLRFGDYVQKGQILFILKTKEASAIGNSVNNLDSSFEFSGVNTIRADAPGYVMQINHQNGDYVLDGEQLAVISDSRSFVFVMNVPYEDKNYVSIGKQVQVILPGDEKLLGTISSSMPMVDSVSQTQSYSIKVNAQHSIPENLVARIKILKTAVNDAQTLPTQCVLSDETQTNFWVMQLVNDSTAVKVPVKTGIQQGDTVQVLSPQFLNNTKILSGGNYGLPDTASVIVSPGSNLTISDSSNNRK